MWELRAGEGPMAVVLRAQRLGDDLVVTLGGGTRPHVGAAAVAQPRPSLKGDGTISATASVIALLGHKEDELARWAALRLASQLNAAVVVTAGIHVDSASPEQIRQLDAAARGLVEELASQLARSR